jgi:hypothetical protein
MSKSNSNQSQNSNPKPRKKNDPRYERVVVGHRLVAMQAHHIDEIIALEGKDLRKAWWNEQPGLLRCRRCFGVLPENRRHFCRWNIAQEGPRNPDPPIRQVPVYRWVLKK